MKSKKVKLQITDQRMLELPLLLKEKELIRYRQEFCDAIDLPKQNIRNIKRGMQHFTALHIANVCREFGINANWIVGVQREVFNSEEGLTKKLTRPPEKRLSASRQEIKSRTG